MELAKYVGKKLKTNVINVTSENSCSKNFVHFQEKHRREIAFLNKVGGYLILTGDVLPEDLCNFKNSFYKKHLQMVASAISIH